jgi:hypothetical protein
MSVIRRREFITLLGSAAAAWPLAARAQQPALPKVGSLRRETLADVSPWVGEFRQGLKEAGFVEGQSWASDIIGVLSGVGLYSVLIFLVTFLCLYVPA